MKISKDKMPNSKLHLQQHDHMEAWATSKFHSLARWTENNFFVQLHMEWEVIGGCAWPIGPRLSY